MRSLSLLVAVSAFSLFAACSSGGGDDSGVHTMPDANHNTHPDASTTPDSAPAGNTATKLGKVCQSMTDCPATAPTCAGVGGTSNWCTLQCGTSTSTTMPPQGGDAMCAAQYDGTSGTPLCAIYDATNPSNVVWYCAVACGTFQGQNLGTCPNNMTCSAMNLCGG